MPPQLAATADRGSPRHPFDTSHLGIKLLTDLHTVFTDHGMPTGLHTVTIIDQLKALPESPWADLYGTGLHDRGLATILGRYEVASRSVRVGDFSRKGYTVDDLWQPWSRCCPNVPPRKGHKGHNPSSTKIM